MLLYYRMCYKIVTNCGDRKHINKHYQTFRTKHFNNYVKLKDKQQKQQQIF